MLISSTIILTKIMFSFLKGCKASVIPQLEEHHADRTLAILQLGRDDHVVVEVAIVEIVDDRLDVGFISTAIIAAAIILKSQHLQNL